MWEIKFKGQDYLLVGDTDGAIASKEDYENFTPSFAHLFPDGTIKRYNSVIGKREDIQFLKRVEE